jgi:2-polyprenyl-3-methyl-5-hydroxy-6-metoxy-1,4-benzoquinol methylase
MSFIEHSSCPICQHQNIQDALIVKDHTVSQQPFEIWHCNNCTGRFTQSIPSNDEIEAFYQSTAYISHTDTKEGLISQLYHSIRKRTLKQKLRLLEKHTKLTTGTALDIGAGTGAFANTLQQAGWNVTGLEPDMATRKKANQLYNIQLSPADQLFDLLPESFNAITLWHVLEHVHNLHGYLEKIKELLQPSGRIFIAVPNHTSADASIYQSFWAAYDVPRHLYHFSPTAMKHLLTQHQLTLHSTTHMWFDSFYVCMLSEQYKNGGKGNIIKAGINGFYSNVRAWVKRERCSSLIYIVGK